MLPQKSGLEILLETRAKNISTPILMLTAKDDKKDVTYKDILQNNLNIRETNYEELGPRF